MIRVFVAASSAVVRSVLKEIILKSKKLEWLGEAADYNSMKSEEVRLAPDVIISDTMLFYSVRNSTLSDYAHSATTPSIVYHQPNDKVYYFSKKVQFLEMPEFINFSQEKIQEYSTYLEQLLLDMKSSEFLDKHPTTGLASIAEDGSITQPLKEIPKDFSDRKFKAVLVGVSTGGPGALLEFLKGIGRNFPLPVIITQHIDSFFDKNLISWLEAEAAVPVHLAENNLKPLAGHIYFAPSDAHVTFYEYPDDDIRIVLNHDEPVNFLRPAVAKMFESAAKIFKENCIAVVLTGMGSDGAKECLQLKQLGAYTITQDQASSVIYGMPKVAYEIGGSCEVLPLKQIPERLWSLTGQVRK
jgi:two-component system chemotaxis response regulator CheB